MICPYCGHEKCYVIDVRPYKDNTIKRRKACSQCGGRYTTIEKMFNPTRTKTVKLIPIATGSDRTHEFVLMVKTKKKEEIKSDGNDG